MALGAWRISLGFRLLQRDRYLALPQIVASFHVVLLSHPGDIDDRASQFILRVRGYYLLLFDHLWGYDTARCGMRAVAIQRQDHYIVVGMLSASGGSGGYGTFHLVELPRSRLLDAPVADIVQVDLSIVVAVMAAVEPDERKGSCFPVGESVIVS